MTSEGVADSELLVVQGASSWPQDSMTMKNNLSQVNLNQPAQTARVNLGIAEDNSGISLNSQTDGEKWEPHMHQHIDDRLTTNLHQRRQAVCGESELETSSKDGDPNAMVDDKRDPLALLISSTIGDIMLDIAPKQN